MDTEEYNELGGLQQDGGEQQGHDRTNTRGRVIKEMRNEEKRRRNEGKGEERVHTHTCNKQSINLLIHMMSFVSHSCARMANFRILKLELLNFPHLKKNYLFLKFYYLLHAINLHWHIPCTHSVHIQQSFHFPVWLSAPGTHTLWRSCGPSFVHRLNSILSHIQAG